MQVKKFYPTWLAGTVMGEVLFQADYVLKELSFGDISLPCLPNAWDAAGGDRGAGAGTAARQWFVVRRAWVVVAADGALVPHCEMGVDARRLVPSPTGYTDAPHTDPDEPTVRAARAITERFREV